MAFIRRNLLEVAGSTVYQQAEINLEAISQMASHPNSVARQGLKPLFFRYVNVAAEAATHNDDL
jgi:hypothetical protein